MQQSAANYYDTFDAVYRAGWGLSLHHGWFDSRTASGSPGIALKRFQEQIVDRLELDQGCDLTLCDVGCGYGSLASDLVQRSLVTAAVGITNSQAQADHAVRMMPQSGRLKIIACDWLRNTLPPETFDRVVAVESLYHFQCHEKEAAIREIARVLRPGGRAVIALWLGRDASLGTSLVDGGMGAWGAGFGALATQSDYLRWFSKCGLTVEVSDDVTRQVQATIPVLVGRIAATVWSEPDAFCPVLRSPEQLIRAGAALASTWLGYTSGRLRYSMIEVTK